ncbi:MAG: hypothetical protein HY509_02780 [Acidobacteria bacterium]|nr:hypothetical protein [Acidobacteriota bacterium]
MSKKSVFSRLLIALPLGFLLASGPGFPGEEGSRKGKPRKFTNDDLKAAPSPAGTPAAAAEEAQDSPDSLRPFRDEAERRAWQKREIEAMQREIAALERQIDYWEKKQLSLRNPLLPRPAPPEGVEAGEGAEPGLDAAAQVERAEEKRVDLRRQVDATRARLLRMEAEIRAGASRPAPETPAPVPPAP